MSQQQPDRPTDTHDLLVRDRLRITWFTWRVDHHLDGRVSRRQR